MVFRGMRLVLPLFGVGLVAVTSASASSPLAVAQTQRPLVALTYIPLRYGAQRVIDQDAAVRFESCPDKANLALARGDDPLEHVLESIG
jgi:hypothetical protein